MTTTTLNPLYVVQSINPLEIDSSRKYFSSFLSKLSNETGSGEFNLKELLNFSFSMFFGGQLMFSP